MYRLRALIIVICMGQGLLTGSQIWAAPSPSSYQQQRRCLTKLKNEIAAQSRERDAEYWQIDLMSIGAPALNKSRIYLGDHSRAVLLVHGFMASPFETDQLARAISMAGYTAYSIQLPGFGATIPITESYHASDWQGAVRTALKTLEACFHEVTLVGMSLGGALVTDRLLDTSEGPRIKSAVLLAPFFGASVRATSWLNWLLSHLFSSVSPKLLYRISGIEDLRAVIDHPTHYNSGMPLNAAVEAIRFAHQTAERAMSSSEVQVPVMLGITESDQTVDNQKSLDASAQLFRARTLDVIPASAQVPHQFWLPSANPDYRGLYARIIRFIAEH